MNDSKPSKAIGLLLYADDCARLEELREKLGIKTYSEVFRFALSRLAAQEKEVI